MKTYIGVSFTVSDGEQETMKFDISHVHPTDLMAVCNKHAAYILQHLREHEQDKQHLCAPGGDSFGKVVADR